MYKEMRKTYGQTEKNNSNISIICTQCSWLETCGVRIWAPHNHIVISGDHNTTEAEPVCSVGP